MRKTFDAELLELNESLTVMARVAQDAIDVVTESLSSGDESTAKAAIDMTASTAAYLGWCFICCWYEWFCGSNAKL